MSGAPDVIRTTAKIQEQEEPMIQKPIIQIEPPPLALTNGSGVGGAGAANTSDASRRQQVANRNNRKTSLDAGTDNPFRPDGKIYKSADPIVDFYRYGPNQSRAQSPTDSQLLLKGGKYVIVKAKKKAKTRSVSDAGQQQDQAGKRSCWRRWLCCCRCNGLCSCDARPCIWCRRCLSCDCCCQRRQRRQPAVPKLPADQATYKSKPELASEHEEETTLYAPTNVDQYSSRPAVDTRAKDFKPTRVVIVDDSSGSNLDTATSGPAIPVAQPKSRCVVS